MKDPINVDYAWYEQEVSARFSTADYREKVIQTLKKVNFGDEAVEEICKKLDEGVDLYTAISQVTNVDRNLVKMALLYFMYGGFDI